MVLSTVFYLLTENLERSNMTLDPMLKWCGSAAAIENFNSEWEVIVLENNAVISQHGYWFVMGDMQNLLTHFSLAVSTVLHQSAFVHTYVNLLCRMQGMNMNWRIVRGEHRENDASEPVHRSFTLEFETYYLNKFYASKIFINSYLHMVSRAEYYAGMWVRNGNQLRVQAIIYAQAHINASFQTPDIDLIRYCAANVDADWFIEALIASFHLDDVFSLPEGGICCWGNILSPNVTDGTKVNCNDMDLTLGESMETGEINSLILVHSGDFMDDTLRGAGDTKGREHMELFMSLLAKIPSDNAKIINRQEWIDPLLSAALRFDISLFLLLSYVLKFIIILFINESDNLEIV
uniref:E3 ubiquitin-protein ligase n=1 Tax=Heterorhabditis bacteriophora TaxID=37862 RepID=A0A1I7X2E1_HETBA